LFTTLGLHLRGDERIQDGSNETTENVWIAIDDDTTLFLPHSDEDADLVLSLLQAAIDNAASRVKLRRQKRERAVPEEEVLGYMGAGASVEAERG
jgi:hypothetical protein